MALDTAADLQAPFFAPDSAIRRIHQEGILILGGGRSLLMQIAHPSVAQGVAEHSSYKTDRTARLMRTLRSTLAVVYGTRAQAEASIAGI
ncbi:MAG: oxygenase MpaB family protein, partial [Dehalococcoidia bacterium]